MIERTTDFGDFWKAYPRKVGKLDAQKAYAKARTQASAAEILDGVTRYIAGKPGYADWAHPATWLRAGRWMDEYGTTSAPVTTPTVDWFEECKRLHGLSCGERLHHYHRMQIDAAKAQGSL